jgi:anti-sigma factor RsiW
VTEEDAREQFSEYLEERLDPARRDAMQAFLAAHPDCAAELIAFERTLSVLHRLPPREPALDMWREFAPRLAEFQTERRTHPARRVTQGWAGLVSQISAGLILWTHALAGRTHARLEKYLLHDPLHHNAQ